MERNQNKDDDFNLIASLSNVVISLEPQVMKLKLSRPVCRLDPDIQVKSCFLLTEIPAKVLCAFHDKTDFRRLTNAAVTLG